MEYTLPPSFNILYLDLPVLHINDTHLQLLQQATEQSIKSQRSLIVLLRLTISRSIQNDKQWKQWQTALGALYMTQARLAYTLNEPLFDMTVMPFQSDDLPRMDLGPDTVVFSTTQDLPTLQKWNEERRLAGLRSYDTRTFDYPEQEQQQQQQPGDDIQDYCFKRTVVGGTFDHLHVGHKILLTMTILLSTQDVVVGVTDDSMLQSKKYKEWMEPIEQRIDHIHAFCKRIRPDISYTVVPIYDPYGPTITDPSIDALVCSQETLKGGHMVNDERRKVDFGPLALRVIDLIALENQLDDKISSTWIRHYLSTRLD